MTNLNEYVPAADNTALLLKWILRARESQMSHYEMADVLGRRNRGIGVAVIGMTAVLGTSAFLSLIAASASPVIRVIFGLVSVTASVLAALQTFLRYDERAEQHRSAGARYGAVRRTLEAAYTRSLAGENHVSADLIAIREELDKLAQEAPNVPEAVFNRTVKTMKVAPATGA